MTQEMTEIPHINSSAEQRGPHGIHYVTVCIDAYMLHQANDAELLIDLELEQVKQKLLALLSPSAR